MKVNASLSADFAGNTFGLLGYIHNSKAYFYRSTSKRHTSQSEFTIADLKEFPLIFIFYGHLGADHTLIDAMIKLSARGIISVGLGSSYQPQPATLALAKAKELGIIVIRSTTMSQGVFFVK